LSNTTNNLLCQKGLNELEYIREITTDLSKKTVISSWLPEEITNANVLKKLCN